MKNIIPTLKKHFKLISGIVGLALVIAWSGGFLAKKTKPGKLESQPGLALPADAEIIEVKVETAPVRVEVVGTSSSNAITMSEPSKRWISIERSGDSI